MCTETPFSQPPNPLAFGRQTPTSLQVRAPVRAGFFDAGDPENFPEQEAPGPGRIDEMLQELLDRLRGSKPKGGTRRGFPVF
jgi:hypothetical protein